MKTTFTYPLPVENYVSGISTTRVGTYTYEGPEQIIYQINGDGSIFEIDPEDQIIEPEKYRKIVDPKNNPDHLPVAYYYQDRFKPNGHQHEYSYEDQTQSNGEVYKAKINPKLADMYQLVWDFDKSNGEGVDPGNWHFKQNVRSLTNKHKQLAESRKEKIGIYTGDPSLTDSVKNGLNAYIAELDTFATNNPPLQEWKFMNTPMVGTMPTLNSDLKLALENLENGPTLEEGI
tara:strand:+ start:1062 stop:1757 length:696 start_codon:yes stop_codon:yes gene_type:complete